MSIDYFYEALSGLRSKWWDATDGQVSHEKENVSSLALKHGFFKRTVIELFKSPLSRQPAFVLHGVSQLKGRDGKG